MGIIELNEMRSPFSLTSQKDIRMKSIVRSGLAALAIEWFIGAGCPAKAEQLVWVRAQPVDHFRAVGLVPPGSYSHNENQRPAAIAVNKAGQDVGEQMQAAKK